MKATSLQCVVAFIKSKIRQKETNISSLSFLCFMILFQALLLMCDKEVLVLHPLNHTTMLFCLCIIIDFDHHDFTTIILQYCGIIVFLNLGNSSLRRFIPFQLCQIAFCLRDCFIIKKHSRIAGTVIVRTQHLCCKGLSKSSWPADTGQLLPCSYSLIDQGN